MTRVIVDGPPYEGWLQIASAMGCHERTARRWSRHPDPEKRVKVAYDPFGHVYAYRAWIDEWTRRNSRTNHAA